MDQKAADELIDQLIGEFPGHRVADGSRAALEARLPAVREVLAAFPDDAYLQRLGSHLLRRGYSDDEAIVAAERAVELKRNWQTVTTLAAAHRARGDTERAAELFDEAWAIDPSDLSSLLDKATVCEEAERLADALEIYERILEVEPRNSWAVPARAWLRASLHDDPDAMRELQDFCRMHPADDYAAGLLRKLA